MVAMNHQDGDAANRREAESFNRLSRQMAPLHVHGRKEELHPNPAWRNDT